MGILKKYNLAGGITPQGLTALLAELGPIFVKLGQIMSIHPGILPAPYLKELEKLKTSVTPMCFADLQSVLEAEYGTELREIFLSFDRQPLGAASIAQTHLASLMDGAKVVVKIQRPKIYDIMYHDIQLIKKAAAIIKFVARIGREIDLNMIIDEIWATAKQELNFVSEAENAREFYANNTGIDFVACPQIIAAYSTARVLVMEYIEGVFVSDLKALENSGYDLEEIAAKLARHFVKQVIEDGFFHADPHGGNILIKNGQIAWLDFGLMGRLNFRDKKLLAEAFKAIAGGDFLQLTDFALQMGVYKGKIDYTALSGAIEIMLNRYRDLDFSKLDLIGLMNDFLAILKENRIGVPKGFATLVRALSTMQGTLRALNPNLNFMEIMVSYLAADQLKNFSWQNELQTMLTSLNFSWRKLFLIPAQISDIFRLFSKGIAKVNLELNMSHEMALKVGQMSNTIALAMLTSALLIGSSLICTADIEPKVLGIPALGGIGFLVAALLGLWVLFAILKRT
jgi:ubiquinone biosynthesis protein